MNGIKRRWAEKSLDKILKKYNKESDCNAVAIKDWLLTIMITTGTYKKAIINLLEQHCKTGIVPIAEAQRIAASI